MQELRGYRITSSTSLTPTQGVADGAALPTKCSPKAPFDDTIYHHDRVFIVAEVDDTYVYHTHLGTSTTAIL